MLPIYKTVLKMSSSKFFYNRFHTVLQEDNLYFCFLVLKVAQLHPGKSDQLPLTTSLPACQQSSNHLTRLTKSCPFYKTHWPIVKAAGLSKEHPEVEYFSFAVILQYIAIVKVMV